MHPTSVKPELLHWHITSFYAKTKRLLFARVRERSQANVSIMELEFIVVANDKNKLSLNWEWGENEGVHRVIN